MGGNNKADYKQSVSGFSLKAEPTEFVNGLNVRNKKEKIKINSQDLGLSHWENYEAIYQEGDIGWRVYLEGGGIKSWF